MTGEVIRQLRLRSGLSQEELAYKMGYTDRSSISRIEKGDMKLTQDKIMEFSTLFKVSPLVILGMEEYVPPKTQVPVYGRVAAGIPIEAIENIIDYEDIPDTWTGTFGAMRIKGDSMAPRILDGDTIIVKRQDDANSGDIVVAIINGQDATVKKLIKHPDGITLQAFNPAYEPMYFSKENMEEIPVTIWGKVVENRSKF